MEITNNKNSPKRVKDLSFIDWIKENNPFITSSLIDAGIAFLNREAEELKVPVINLLLDGQWHYLDKPTKKQSYRARLEIDFQGIPTLFLTYYTFRHGGVSVPFNSKEVLKELWVNARLGRMIKPVLKVPARTEEKQSLAPASNDGIKSALAHWQTMATEGQSPYLNRKGLAYQALPGIRFAKNHLAVAIIDTQEAFHGLQTIFNDGQKRFSKGLAKKGHFALLGARSLPLKPTTLHLCEGVATAATLHLALQEPVFAALDAFNLLPAARALKRHYPKTPIVIWADNDWQKAEKQTRFGHVLGNTGLIQANRAAFKLRNALVATPDFSTLADEEKKEATDFNDLALLAGLNALRNTKPQQPDLSLALWHELNRYNKHAHGVLSPSQFEQGTKVSYHSRYLPKELFKREGVHLVRSAIGTGKTEVVEQWLKKNPRQSVLFTTHLISLVESAAQRLGLVSYNDCDTLDLQIENRLAICLNSLGKLTAEGALKPYDIVVIDEVEQVLARLTTAIDQKPLVFAVLQHLMSRASTLICLDAHLSRATAELIQRFCPDKPVTIHFNHYEPGKARELLVHESPESVQMAALQALEAGEAVYLAFNSKKEAFKTFSAFNLAFPEKKGLYISSDNSGDKNNQAFFNNVNVESKRYDYLVCTPSVSTGVSIDNGHFDFVGGVFNAQVNTANDCMQALGRIRNHPSLHVFCDKRLGNKPLCPEIIASKWGATHQHDLNLMNLNAQGLRILLNPDYERLSLVVTQARNASFNDFYQQFVLLALHDGMRLSYYETALDVELKQGFKQFKENAIVQDLNELSEDSLPLTPAQLLALAKKPRKTMMETKRYQKQQLIEFFNLSERDEESISALSSLDNDGRFKKKLLSLELALSDLSVARERFLQQMEAGEQFAADLTHFATLQTLYQKLLATLQVNTLNGVLSSQGYRYSKETLLASGFLHWLDANRPVLQGVITLPTLAQLTHDPLRFVSLLLARLNLKQKRVGKAEEGVYQLDEDRLSLLNGLLARRKAGMAGLTMPLDTTSVVVKKERPLEFFVDCFKKVKAFFSPPLLPLPI